MQRRKNLSEDFITKLIELSAGKVNPGLIENFIAQTESVLSEHYFTESSESNLLRIIQNQFDLQFFISDLIKYPHHLEILISLSVNSNYLTDILVRNPEYFYWVTRPDILNLQPDEKYFRRTVENSVIIFKSFDARVNALRNLKRKEILRIGLKDFFLKASLPVITAELSLLAKAISSKLFKLCYEQILNKYKPEKVNRKFCVISLGKLGAMELNYSSDIDLICFYDKNSLINKKISYGEIISETIKLFIECSSQITANGYLYRVDFRLRPDGRNSPLANSISEYIRYYETRSEDWEKQMLIKTGFLCGSKSLFKRFFDFKEKIVFGFRNHGSPIQQIKKLKQSIESGSSEDNIKLSSGGIRDIEFAVQALQLLNGNKIKELHTSDTLQAIEALYKNNLITSEEMNTLSESYIFYRAIEHYLQLMNDRQTHTIPESGELHEKIAFYLGFKNVEDFRNEIINKKEKVIEFFKSVVQSDSDDTVKFNFHFRDQLRAKNNLEFLRTGRSLLGTKQFDTKTILLFDSISNDLFDYLDKSVDPDTVLENFAKIIRLVKLPQIWYEEFRDKKFFRFFLKFCEYSQKGVNKFFENDFIKDDLLSRTCFSETEIKTDLPLPLFHFRISVQHLEKNILPPEANLLITEYHHNKIFKIISELNIEEKLSQKYFIAGLGSFGSGDMSFSSDVDLIFVVQNISEFPDVQKIFQNLLSTLKNEIKGTEFDCRLRPEGKSSYIVWDINEYKKYLKNRARVWEFQAFTKCRFVAGSINLYRDLIDVYTKQITSIAQPMLKSEIISMKNKITKSDLTGFNIKNGKGGLTDLDFILSFLLLKNINQFSNLIGKDTKDKIHKLKEIIELDDYKRLKENFTFLKNVELSIQNLFDIKTAKLPVDNLQLLKLSLYNGFQNEIEFTNYFNNVISSNISMFNKIFELK